MGFDPGTVWAAVCCTMHLGRGAYGGFSSVLGLCHVPVGHWVLLSPAVVGGEQVLVLAEARPTVRAGQELS